MTFLKEKTAETDLYRESGSDNLENFLSNHPELVLEVDSFENSKRKTRILKCGRAYNLYKDFLLFYIFKTLLLYCDSAGKPLSEVMTKGSKEEHENWTSMGGQLIRERELEELKSLIKSRKLNSWDDIHNKYAYYAGNYEQNKLQQVISIFRKNFDNSNINILHEKFVEVCQYISEQTYKSRAKDYSNPFRMCTYDNSEEMEEVVGKLENNDFIAHINKEMNNLIFLAGKYLRPKI